MDDSVKAVCGACGAKYRLPVEAAGRTARCKKCGGKFDVPQVKKLEDSVLDWLSDVDEPETPAEQPRVINIPKDASDGHAPVPSGPIRLKSTSTTDSKSGGKH